MDLSPFSSRDDAGRPQPTGWVDRRRQKIADEIARNRRGDYVVPTWVLAALLAVIVGGWVALIVLA
ncbi:MAG TPA: hypothetical protein VFX60_05425 [Micromonospora sp.]|nr:hypothetical protein [Micromonospora sp.]